MDKKNGRPETTNTNHPVIVTHSDAAARIVERLDGVKRTGPGRWLAKCPAHDDRSPSLSVREAEDGRVLLRCWSGCTASEVMGAIGLSLRDLFPASMPAPGVGPIPVRRRWDRGDVWLCLRHEAAIAMLASRAVANGEQLSPEDADRISLAAARLDEAIIAFGIGGGA